MRVQAQCMVGDFKALGLCHRLLTLLDLGGELDGVRIIGAATLDLMIADSIGDIPLLWPVQGLGFGLGFAVLRDPKAALAEEDRKAIVDKVDEILGLK